MKRYGSVFGCWEYQRRPYPGRLPLFTMLRMIALASLSLCYRVQACISTGCLPVCVCGWSIFLSGAVIACMELRLRIILAYNIDHRVCLVICRCVRLPVRVMSSVVDLYELLCIFFPHYMPESSSHARRLNQTSSSLNFSNINISTEEIFTSATSAAHPPRSPAASPRDSAAPASTPAP